MKIHSTDKSVLMEVADVRPDRAGILITGKIMGAMPMKAVVEPAEVRRMLGEIGLWKILRIAWLVCFMRKRKTAAP
jgi:hypothetical protein